MRGKPPRNLHGQKFGRLTVIDKHPVVGQGGAARWICVCDCGNTKVVYGHSLLNRQEHKRTKSCGCWKAELARNRGQRMSAELTLKNTKHGLARNSKKHPLYTRWQTMRRRCNSPAATGYERYGGRGIQVCAAWDDFAQFVADVGMPPTPIHTLDRIDNNGNYEPSNVRWATPAEQNANRGY